MSTKRKPLLSEDQLAVIVRRYTPNKEVFYSVSAVESIVSELDARHEAARDKDEELIQKLVNALHDSYPNHHEDAHSRYNDALDAADAAGFKPN